MDLVNSHKFLPLYEAQKRKEWDQAKGMAGVRDAVGKRVGVLGYGSIGRQGKSSFRCINYMPGVSMHDHAVRAGSIVPSMLHRCRKHDTRKTCSTCPSSRPSIQRTWPSDIAETPSRRRTSVARSQHSLPSRGETVTSHQPLEATLKTISAMSDPSHGSCTA